MTVCRFPLRCPAVCGEMLLQGHLLISDLGRISPSVAPSSCHAATLGLLMEGDPCQARAKSHSVTDTHQQRHAHGVPFLLTYPEQSRDRLAVTRCSPATSDLPESSKRAEPWHTTEIQLPNQAGRQVRGDRGNSGKRQGAEWRKKKLN